MMNNYYCQEGKIKEKEKIRIKYSDQAGEIGFDSKIYDFFGFGLFRPQVDKIVFRIQNF